MDQNYKNHIRFDPVYHYFGLLVLVAVLIGAVVNVFQASAEGRMTALLILGLSILVTILMLISRGYALKVQDRAIRSEENFRHYVLTGKAHDTRLTMSQIIALRFAQDEELAELARRSAEEGLSSKEIKQLVKNWRGDYHRA